FQRQLLTSYTSLSVTGSWPNQLIWADFNGDHRMELLTGGEGSALTIRQVEAGSLPLLAQLVPQTDVPRPNDDFPRAYDLGDFDNDGAVDLLLSVLVDAGGGTIRPRLFVYRNLGGFQFERVVGAGFDF